MYYKCRKKTKKIYKKSESILPIKCTNCIRNGKYSIALTINENALKMGGVVGLIHL